MDDRKHGFAMRFTATLREKTTGLAREMQLNACIVIYRDGRGMESAALEAQKDAVRQVVNPDQFELVSTAVNGLQEIGPAYEGRIIEG